MRKWQFGMVGAAGVLALTGCADKSVVGPGASATPRAVIIGDGDQPSVPGPTAVGSPATYPLYAGGGGSGPGTLVGFVSVYSAAHTATASNPNDYTIHATYNAYPGFCISETHLSVQLQATMVPQKNGNPIPGQFEHKGGGGCETSVQYSKVVDLGGDAGVERAEAAVVSGSGLVGAGSFVSGGSLSAVVTARRSGDAAAASAVASTPVAKAWEAYGDPADVMPSLWDAAIAADPHVDANGRTGGANGQWLLDSGADWVWESHRSNGVNASDAREGAVIKMEATVNSPVAQGGIFRITCDNAYRVDFKGASITAPDGATAGYTTQLSSGLFAALTSNLGAGVNLRQPNVTADGWQSTESYNVTLSPGANTFTIYAANEYMNTDDAHTGYPVGPRRRAGTNDPLGTADVNPAGCIFGLQTDGVRTSIGEETAWGAPNGFTGATTGTGLAGGNFGGKNWATYFTYEVR